MSFQEIQYAELLLVMAYNKGFRKDLFISEVHGQHMESVGGSAYYIIIRKDSKDFL